VARQRTPIGQLGKINTTKLGPNYFIARARLRTEDGRTHQISRTGRSVSAAENALKEASKEARRMEGAELSRTTTLDQLAEAFLAHKRTRLASSTLETYESVIRNHISPSLGGREIREATIPQLQRFIDKVAADHGSGAAHTARSVLSGMFALAVRLGAIEANPSRELEGHSTRPQNAAKPIRGAELREFLRLAGADQWAIDHDMPDLLTFMAGIGCRIGEACALRWEDVELEIGTVTISGTVERVTGKGHYRKETTKTAAGLRTLKLPEPVVGMLVERRVAHPFVSSGWVFPSPKGKLRDPANTEHDLGKLRTRIGFPDVKFHSFRHGIADELKDAGVDPRDRADYLGHEKIDLTLSVYTTRGGGSSRVADVLGEAIQLR
jgi:integrase